MAGRGRIGVLISGRGSNMAALAEACAAGRVHASIALVISNDAAAGGLAVAAASGLATRVIDHRASRTRVEHDAAMEAALRESGVDLVCLAGYMRLLSAPFVQAFAGRVMNIHPSLLPAFPGLDAQAQALAHGVKVTGATVHFVDEKLDHGPIILQAVVPVEPDDTEATLSARILVQEHRIYPEAVGLYFDNRLRIEGRKVRITGR
jgi:phosphoribosylglycinamide formyltransferase-1